jgi:CBS domain-containing protein
MRAHDIMSRPVYSVRTTDTVESAAALLTEKKVTAAPVIDEAGELVGMVSEGDLLWHRVPEDPTAHMWRGVSDDLGERPRVVADVMSGSPVTTWPDADVADVAQLMLHHDIRSVPVVDHGDLIGIVSRRDILRTVVRGDDTLEPEIQHRLDEYAGRERR